MIAAAQVSSSFAFVGRHVKIRRRLGVSDTPVTADGPMMRHVAHVRQRGDAVADVDVGQRVLERRDQIVDRAVNPLNERHRDALRARADVNRAAS